MRALPIHDPGVVNMLHMRDWTQAGIELSCFNFKCTVDLLFRRIGTNGAEVCPVVVQMAVNGCLADISGWGSGRKPHRGSVVVVVVRVMGMDVWVLGVRRLRFPLTLAGSRLRNLFRIGRWLNLEFLQVAGDGGLVDLAVECRTEPFRKFALVASSAIVPATINIP